MDVILASLHLQGEGWLSTLLGTGENAPRAKHRGKKKRAQAVETLSVWLTAADSLSHRLAISNQRRNFNFLFALSTLVNYSWEEAQLFWL